MATAVSPRRTCKCVSVMLELELDLPLSPFSLSSPFCLLAFSLLGLALVLAMPYTICPSRLHGVASIGARTASYCELELEFDTLQFE